MPKTRSTKSKAASKAASKTTKAAKPKANATASKRASSKSSAKTPRKTSPKCNACLKPINLETQRHKCFQCKAPLHSYLVCEQKDKIVQQDRRYMCKGCVKPTRKATVSKKRSRPAQVVPSSEEEEEESDFQPRSRSSIEEDESFVDLQEDDEDEEEQPVLSHTSKQARRRYHLKKARTLQRDMQLQPFSKRTKRDILSEVRAIATENKLVFAFDKDRDDPANATPVAKLVDLVQSRDSFAGADSKTVKIFALKAFSGLKLKQKQPSKREGDYATKLTYRRRVLARTMHKFFAARLDPRQKNRNRILDALCQQLVDDFSTADGHTQRTPKYVRHPITWRSAACQEIWDQAWAQFSEANPEDHRVLAATGADSKRGPPQKKTDAFAWAVKDVASASSKPVSFTFTSPAPSYGQSALRDPLQDLSNFGSSVHGHGRGRAHGRHHGLFMGNPSSSSSSSSFNCGGPVRSGWAANGTLQESPEYY